MDMPIRYVAMSPLCNSYVRLFIQTANACSPLYGTQNLFVHPNGHPLNRVELMGIVREKVVKEEYTKLSLEDGTGSIQCILGTKHSDDSEFTSVGEMTKKCIQKFVEQNPSRRFSKTDDILQQLLKNTTVDADVGDIVLLQGSLRPLKWRDGIQLKCTKLQCLSNISDVLDAWQDWTQETIILDEHIYCKLVVPQEQMEEISRSRKMREMIGEITEKLKSLFSKNIFAPEGFCAEFYGYEVLEFDFVTPAFDEVFSSSISSHTATEILQIKQTAIIAILQQFITLGVIFKRKGFLHTRITGIEQLDAIYFVTKKCTKLVEIVGCVFGKIPGDEFENAKYAIEKSNYTFLAGSKHLRAIFNHITLYL